MPSNGETGGTRNDDKRSNTSREVVPRMPGAHVMDGSRSGY